MQPNYSSNQVRRYQQRPQQFSQRGDLRGDNNFRAGFQQQQSQFRGGFNGGVRPQNNFRNQEFDRYNNDAAFQPQNNYMPPNTIQSQQQFGQPQKQPQQQFQQVGYFNQGYYQQPQGFGSNQMPIQNNMQFNPLAMQQAQIQGDQQFYFQRDDPTQIAGIPNLVNPPAPSLKVDQKTQQVQPTQVKKEYDDLFSSEDDHDKRKQRVGSQSQRNQHRSKEDPRLERKRADKSNFDEQRTKISASLNLYRAADESKDNPKPSISKTASQDNDRSPPRQRSQREQAPQQTSIQWKTSQKSTNQFSLQRLKSSAQQSPNSKVVLSTDQQDYLKQLCKKASMQRDVKEKKDREERQKRKQDQPMDDRKAQKTVGQRVYETKVIAEYFYLFNETNWNKFDDRFYFINRRWFDRWKDFISFDYIVKQIIELGKSESDLSINRVLQNNSNPQEVSNTQLLLEHRDFIKNKNERHHYCNFPLKKDIVPDRDMICVTEPIWKFFKERYGGEEIKRYAVYKNPANVLDRSPFLPIVTMCLVIYDETIRPPKNLVLPRKMRFSYLKTLVKESFNWLKDIPNDSIRLWRLLPHISEKDFIEQYNSQKEAETLPELLKFPGLSLENSLDFYVEEYGTINLNKHVIFVEVKKNKGQWVFQLEQNDPMIFDDGSTDLTQHKKLYTDVYSQPAPERSYYQQYFKYHNNTNKEYNEAFEESKTQQPWLRDICSSDLVARMAEGNKLQCYSLPEHIYFEVFQQMALFPNKNLQTLREHLELPAPDTVAQSILIENKDIMTLAQTNIRSSLRNKEKETTLGDKNSLLSRIKGSPNQIQIHKHAICNSCGSKTPLKQVIFCQACSQTPYCSSKCRTKDIRFHEVDCEPQDVIQAAQSPLDQNKFAISSSDSESEEMLILEILKSRIDKDVVDDLDQNVFSKRTKKRRKLSDQSQDSDFVESKTMSGKRSNKLGKKSTTLKKSQETTGPSSEQLTSQKQSQGDSSKNKTQTQFEGPDLVTLRLIKTVDSNMDSLASLLVLITQISSLRESVYNTRMMETDPLCSGLRDLFQQLIVQSPAQTALAQAKHSDSNFQLLYNPLPHHLNTQSSLSTMYDQLVKQLAKDNSQLGNSMLTTLQQVYVCNSCGNRTNEELNLPVLTMTNEKPNQFVQQRDEENVKLKIIYIFDEDCYKKYELRLRPGEYTFQEITSKIKEMVQVDRIQLKMGKRSFILVDLFENMAFSSQINNESMKFSFVLNQQLTTFAYETFINIKHKIKRYNFLHIGKRKSDEFENADAGKIEYFSFPHLVVYGEQDRLSDIAQKILKALKQLLVQSGLESDSGVSDMNAKDTYQHYYKNGQKNMFDILLVLKDGQRWKLDPSVHPSKKLNTTVDLDNVVRVECIFAPEAKLDQIRKDYIAQIESETAPVEQQGIREVARCFQNLCKQTNIEPDAMPRACVGCSKKVGLQKTVEIARLGPYVAIQVDKSDAKQNLNYGVKLNLEKYMRTQKILGASQNSSSLDLVALIAQNCEETKDNCSHHVFLKHNDPMKWVKYTFGPNPTRVAMLCEDCPEEITNDCSIKFALYRKEWQNTDLPQKRLHHSMY